MPLRKPRGRKSKRVGRTITFIMCRCRRRDTASQVARRLSDQDIMRRYRMTVFIASAQLLSSAATPLPLAFLCATLTSDGKQPCCTAEVQTKLVHLDGRLGKGVKTRTRRTRCYVANQTETGRKIRSPKAAYSK